MDNWIVSVGNPPPATDFPCLGPSTDFLSDAVARFLPSSSADIFRNDLFEKSKNGRPVLYVENEIAQKIERLKKGKVLSQKSLLVLSARQYANSEFAPIAPAIFMSQGPFPRMNDLRVPARRQSTIGTGVDWDLNFAHLKSQAEALERYVSMRKPRILKRATERELTYAHPVERLISPSTFAPLVSPPIAHSAESKFETSSWIPFDCDQAIDWTLAHDEIQNQSAWVPADYAVYPALGPTTLVYETSNGCAFHPDPTEAKIRGTLELLERDALLTAWLTRAPLSPLKPAFKTSRARSWSESLALQGFQQTWWDLSKAHGIPAVLLQSTHKELGHLFCASIAWTFEDACEKALLDQTPALFTAQDMRYKNALLSAVHDHRRFYLNTDLPADALDFLDASRPFTSAPSAPLGASPSKESQWDFLLSHFNQNGFSLLSLALHHPGEDFSAYRMISPELQPLYFNEKLRRISPHRFPGGPEQWKNLNPYPHPIA